MADDEASCTLEAKAPTTNLLPQPTVQLPLHLSPKIHHHQQHQQQQDYIEIAFAPSDPAHPHRLSRARKWTIVLLLCTATINMGYTSAVYSPAFSAAAT